MCGIVGFFNCGNREELGAATLSMAHRGPDDSGVQWFDAMNCGLGHRRLSIIDLSENGHQPMYQPESGNWIIYNGEIYNYKEVRQDLSGMGYTFRTGSDTEVILWAYYNWGKDCLNRLNGMFSFLIYNEHSSEVFAARDRLGIKPFYYYCQDDKLIISSELKAILACSDYVKEPDFAALHTPVHFQITPTTGFKGISKLPPGYFLEWKKKDLKLFSYWQIAPIEKDINPQEGEEILESLLLDSVRLQMIADVPVGVLLSGGLDSSIISAMMLKNTNNPITSFTIKFKEKDLKQQGNVNDSWYAKRLAHRFGFIHHEIEIEPDIINLVPKMVWHLEEPIADPASINTYLISKAARDRNIIVLLNGMGGDEVFAGYRAQLACLKADTYNRYLPSFARSLLKKGLSHIPQSTSTRNLKYFRWMKQFSSFASLPRFERYLAAFNSSLREENFNQYYLDTGSFKDTFYYKRQKGLFYDNGLSYLTQICLNDTRVYLPDHNLAYSDKSSMAASVESRPPLIDHRIVEFMFSLRPDFRINKNIQKYLLKKVSAKYLPEEIIKRPKAPFSAPMRGWLKNELREYVGDILSYDSLKRRGVYNPDYVTALIRENDRGLQDNSQLIWRLVINETWFRTFF
jgi:asparagine synthase (glutamine-hydrolysing)